MGNKLIKTLIVAVGLLVTVTTLIFFVRDFSRINNWKSSGFVLSVVRQNQDASISFLQVNEGDYISQPLPVVGDTLISIADSSASMNSWIQILETPHHPGKEVEITYKHQGEILNVLVKTRPVDTWNFIFVVGIMVLRLLMFFAFAALGFWAYFRRSESTAVRVFALYAFSMCSYTGAVYMPMFAQMSSIQIPWENIFREFLAYMQILFSSYWLLLQFVFPKKSKLYLNRPWLVYALTIIPQFIFIVLSWTSIDNTVGFEATLSTVVLLQTLAGIIILRRNYLNADNNIEKRQTKLVFWGSGLGLVIFLIYLTDFFTIITAFQSWPLPWRLTFHTATFLILLASPASFVYAFGRYRLLEVEARLRRGTQYMMTLGIILVVFVGVLYLAGVVFMDDFGANSKAPILLMALVIAFGFAPVQKALRQNLENRFFPERKRLRQIVTDFLQTSSTLPDCGTLCGGLEEMLKNALGVGSVQVVIKGSGDCDFHLTMRDEEVPVSPDGDLLNYLQNESHPLFIDEATASSRIIFTSEELRWLHERAISFILPMRIHQVIIGFICFSEKTDQEDFHPEELQLLMTLTGQIALAIQNLSLLEENLEKRRMEQEARDVQLRFLPQQLPETPGLDVHARSTFCLEVAGDYYDVLKIDDRRTLIAVGDVSGKGTGAALIMANLQASLKAFAGLDLRLADIIARINDLIFANTDAGQFVTFFAGIYDSGTRSLTYVNAGHDPPFLVRKGQKPEKLVIGGMLIGVFEGQKYREGTVSLNAGDILVIYTDGISEAMNESDEEYGQKRIVDSVTQNLNLTAVEISDSLIEDVKKYHKGESTDDDMTLLVAKVENSRQ